LTCRFCVEKRYLSMLSKNTEQYEVIAPNYIDFKIYKTYEAFKYVLSNSALQLEVKVASLVF
jgi:hypothetical protein